MSNKNKSPGPMAEGQRAVSPYSESDEEISYSATRNMPEDWYGKGYDSSTQQRPRLSGVCFCTRSKEERKIRWHGDG
ncbi:hypothetical protein HanIR_Chr09g0395921 [Helianthus annuus]|nr:hypothetical protein HanIR_Chr09g0395921 [Helianthus annuus]